MAILPVTVITKYYLLLRYSRLKIAQKKKQKKIDSSMIPCCFKTIKMSISSSCILKGLSPFLFVHIICSTPQQRHCFCSGLVVLCSKCCDCWVGGTSIPVHRNCCVRSHRAFCGHLCLFLQQPLVDLLLSQHRGTDWKSQVGPGLWLPHPGGIRLNRQCKIL